MVALEVVDANSYICEYLAIPVANGKGNHRETVVFDFGKHVKHINPHWANVADDGLKFLEETRAYEWHL